MGYLGNKPADSYLTLEKQTFTTSATDTYTLDREVSSVNDIELFLNNVRQEPTTAYTISGTTLTLASAITSSDSMYCIYQGRAVGTTKPADNTVTNDMISYPLAESGATVATLNRTSSDGDIVELQKDGTTIGSIGVDNGDNLTISGNSTHAGFNFGTSSVVAYKNGNFVDNEIDLGTNITRYQNLYLGGNIYLGGTGTANALDDYEEGTWTPSFEFGSAQPTAGNTTGGGFYTKVGNMVTVWGTVKNVNVTGASGDVKIRDLPFTSKLDSNLTGYMGTFSIGNATFSGYLNCDVEDGTSTIRPLENISGSTGRDVLNVANCNDGATDVYFCVNYQVN